MRGESDPTGWPVEPALTNCYLAQLPRKFLRTMAGFQPDDYCPGLRSSRESLVRASGSTSGWPGSTPIPPGSPEPQGEESPDRDDMAAQGFLRLLAELRTILLQDSVLLRQEFPGHPMWDHEIFQRPDYAEFAARLQQSLAVSTTAEEVQLQQALPLVTDRLTVFHRDLHQAVDSQRPRPNSRPSRPNSRRPGPNSRWPRPNSRGSTRGSTTWPPAERPSSSELLTRPPTSPTPSEQRAVPLPRRPILTARAASAVGAQAGMPPSPPTRYTRFPGPSVRSRSCGMNGRLGSRASRPSRIWSGRTDQPGGLPRASVSCSAVGRSSSTRSRPVSSQGCLQMLR